MQTPGAILIKNIEEGHITKNHFGQVLSKSRKLFRRRCLLKQLLTTDVVHSTITIAHLEPITQHPKSLTSPNKTHYRNAYAEVSTITRITIHTE